MASFELTWYRCSANMALHVFRLVEAGMFEPTGFQCFAVVKSTSESM